MEMTDAAMGGPGMASQAVMLRYSVSIARKAMDAELQSAARLLEMLPEQPLRVSGPQPGDVPLISRGSFLDVYA